METTQRLHRYLYFLGLGLWWALLIALVLIQVDIWSAIPLVWAWGNHWAAIRLMAQTVCLDVAFLCGTAWAMARLQEFLLRSSPALQEPPHIFLAFRVSPRTRRGWFIGMCVGAGLAVVAQVSGLVFG